MDATGQLRTWGSGCPCCEERRRQGAKVNCTEQGRRLPEARKRVFETFLVLVNQCGTGPLPHHMGAGEELEYEDEEERQFAWLHCGSIVFNHFDYLKHQPYTLSEITCAAELEIERDIWASLPSKRRHRVSNFLFDEYQRSSKMTTKQNKSKTQRSKQQTGNQTA